MTTEIFLLLFTFSGSKIIIYGGDFWDPKYRKAEVIDLLNHDLKCGVPYDKNETGHGAYGGRIDDYFVYCGGRDHQENGVTDKCYKLGQNEPIFNITMSTPRWDEFIGNNGIVLPNNSLFIIGNKSISLYDQL